MSTSLLSIGLTGLNAAQAGILTTGNNIANASTPGYNREQIVQATAIPNLTGGGFIGQGTNVQTVTRSYSQYLNTQLLSAQTGAASLTSYGAQIAQIDNMLADPSAGLSPALANFFQGVQQAAANPASIPSRQAMLSNAQALVSSFQSINQTLQGIRDGTNTQISGEVTLINSYASQLAAVNQQIVLAQAGNNQPANSLLDQRDQLVSSLNKEIGVSTAIQSDGTYNVFIGNGQPLVVGNQAATLSTVQDPNDPQKTAVAFQVPGGTRAILSDSLLSGGTLGGLVGFRDNSLDSAQNQLGLIAIGLATSFNAQSQLGQDLNGNLGGKFFSVSSPAIIANSLNSDYKTLTTLPAATVSDVSKLTASDYRLTANGGGKYTLLNLSDNTTVASGLTVDPVTGNLTDASQTPSVTAFDGLTINVSSAPASGDSFLIQPTRNGAANIAVSLSDPNAIALAAPIVTAASQKNSSTATISPGVVSNTAATLAAPFTITYQSGPPAGFTGFPVGSTVIVDGTSYQITGPTMAVPTGANISVDGVGVAISGSAPVANDTITFNPPRIAPTNVGGSTVTVGTVTSTNSLPAAAITLTYDATSNTLSGFPVGAKVTVNGTTTTIASPTTSVAYTSGATIAFNGISFAISGTPNTGDTFTVGPNANGVSDSRNGLLLGQLQTAKILESTGGSPTASLQDAYSQIVSEVGNKAREVQVTGAAQTSLATQAQTARDSFSAVNLDEEAANLIQYQQAYQASAKMITIAGKLFDSILGI
ncbi:flagellar hook-associated protein 1 [mine drainage metagenome]|uniref:Flagellar hook-associated protein 1 n=1 Tax=mine drainage metagenome TaxID=410659 RepID=A0A1J5RMN7_9ZZZZ